MCRLAAVTSKEYTDPIYMVEALETMKEGHDGSGMGVLLRDLGNEFIEFKDLPILSGIASDRGIELIDEYMTKLGFALVYNWTPKIKPVPGIIRRDHYFARVYDYPQKFREASEEEKNDLLMSVRLNLRRMGASDESIIVFSFYPDTIMLKEVGDPLEVAEFFSLDEMNIKAKIVLAQGRQNTNYSINLYACHPFFLQGYSTMTNGENTAFVPIREFLMSRGFPGYTGYDSDSEVFTHILHYTMHKLKYPLVYYKDVVTPLKPEEAEKRPEAEALKLMRYSLRRLCIDGPNCVIGLTPDNWCFMLQDTKKLRPGVVGGVPGKYGLMSEVCGLDTLIPERDKSLDVYPMKYDFVLIPPGAEKVLVWDQLKGEFKETGKVLV